MTEVIMIDGVNVAECVWFNKENENCYDEKIVGKCKGDKCYYKEYARLKQENEKLLKAFTKGCYLNLQHECRIWELKESSYRKAIEEIREIADIIYNTNCNYVAEVHKILNKINEVLG